MMKVSPTGEKTKSSSTQLTTAWATEGPAAVEGTASVDDGFGFPPATVVESAAPKRGLSVAAKAPRASEVLGVSGLQLSKEYVRYRSTLELALAFNKTKHPQTKKDLKDVALQVIQEFTRRQTKTHDNIRELVPLAACEDPEISQHAYIAIIQPIYDGVLIEEHLLQALADMVEITPKGFIPKDNVVKMLDVVAQKMAELYAQESDKLAALLSATASILNSMLDKELSASNFVLSKEAKRDPLYNLLTSVQGGKDRHLSYLSAYALEALLRVPDDESKLSATLRHATFLFQGAMGLAKIVASQGASIGEIVDVVENFKQGLTFQKRKSTWFDLTRRTLDMLNNSTQDRHLLGSVLEALREKGPAIKEWRFIYGITEGFKQTAQQTTDPLIPKKILELLKEIYLSSGWSKTDEAYDQLLTVLIDLIKTSPDPLSTQARKTLVQVELQLPADKKAKARLRFHAALLKEGVKEAKEIETLPQPPKIDSRADLDLLGPARKLAFPLDYRIELMIEASEKLRSPGEPLAQDLKLYVPVQGKPSEHATERFAMLPETLKFLTPEQTAQQVLLVQGGAGSGKSLFLRFIETQLWQAYAPGQPIPLFISLPSLVDPVHNAVEQVLARFGCTPDEIRRFQKERTFILILDGFDEIRTSQNLYHSNQLNQWKAKVLVTSRSEYLAGRDYRSLFKADQRQAVNDLAELHIVPFEKPQVDAYLQNIAGQQDSLWQDWQQYRNALDTIPGLNDLVSTPFVLSIITQVLPQLEAKKKQEVEGMRRPTTRADVYETFVSYWFEKEERKLLSSGAKVPEEYNLKNSFAKYCQDLSLRLFLSNKTAVQAQSADYSIQKLKEDEWARFFRSKEEDVKVYLARQGALLRRTGTQVSFIHKSIMEYFVAVLLYQEIVDHAEDNLEESSFFNQKWVKLEPSLVRFLVDLIQGKYQETQTLLKIVESTKGNPRLGIAGANAITLLNQLSYCFSGLDLRGIQIPGADLENALMHRTHLQGADLTGVNLRNAYLIGTDLSKAHLKDLYFAEYPHLKGNTSISSVCYSPDGAVLATTCGNEIQLWEAKTGQPRGTPLKGHTAPVSSVAFSPDGSCLASGSYDNSVRLWDPKAGRALGEPLKGHTSVVYSVAFSPDGSCLASGSDDKSVRLWDPKAGRALGEPLKGHTSTVLSVAFSPDGSCLASGSSDYSVRLWDPKAGRALGEPLQGHTESVNSVAFSPDGSCLASGSRDQSVRLWDPKAGRTLGEPLMGHTGGVYSVAFSPDGSCLASGSVDYSVRLWDPKAGRALGEPLQGHTESVLSVAFSPDGSCLASGSNDKSVRLWDPKAGRALGEPLQGHTGTVSSIAFSPDGSCLASGSWDKSVRLWDPKAGRALGESLMGHTSGVYSVAFSPDGSCLASGSKDNSVRLWDPKAGRALGEPLMGHTDAVFSVAFSPDGSCLASGSVDYSVRLWDPKAGRALGEPLQGHTESVLSVAFSPDGSCLASGSVDYSVRLWDPKAGRALGEPLQGHTGGVNSVAFSPDGSCLASGSWDNSVRLWDPKAGRALGEPLKGHTDTVRSVAFSPDGSCLASGSDDKSVRLWDCKDLNHVQSLGAPILFNATPTPFYSKEGTLCVVERDKSIIRIWASQRLPNGQTEWLVQAKTPPTDILRVNEVNLSGSTGLSNSNYRLLMQRNAIDTTPELHTHFDEADEAAASAISDDSDTEQKTGAMVAATKTVHTTPSIAQLLGQSQEKLFRGILEESQQKLLKELAELKASQARMEAEMKASRGPSKLVP